MKKKIETKQRDPYTCAMCGGTFETQDDWTEEDRMKEKEENFPDVPLEECDVVCDDCYQLLGITE